MTKAATTLKKRPTPSSPPSPPSPHPPALSSVYTQEDAARQFARRLNDLIVEAGMNQSQLAALVFGTTEDTRGFTVSKGRDRISNYLRGRDIPRAQNLKKIADVFRLSVQDLAPELASLATTRDPEVMMHMVAGRPDQVRLTVNTLVPLSLAAQVIALISDHTQRDKHDPNPNPT